MSRFGSRSRVSTYLSDWMPTGDENLTPPTSVDFLVVAGGGSSSIGGGGAGGVRSSLTNTGKNGTLESALSVTAGVSLTVTVGAGGTASATDATQGTSGVDSVFSTFT